MNGFVLPDVALAPMMPILLTLLGAIAATVLGFFLPRRAVAVISLVSLVLSAVSMFTLWDRGLTSFGGSLQADNAAIALGIVLLIGSALAVLVSLDTAGRSRLNFPEFDAVLMFAVTGTLVIAFSGDLITMLIGLEVMSLSGYVLATLQDSRESEESGLKYFLLGATGSAILIYGIALVYGATGSFNFAGIAAASSGLQVQNLPLLVAGALLLLCGFGFKVALAPFHQWTPDVYGGAPTVVSLFLSTTVKVGAFAGLLRVFSGALHNAPNWLDVLAILTAATLVVGNLAALFQTNFKRLLAYSAVAQTGFLALTLLGTPELGGAALAYYLLIYTLTTAAALAVVAGLQRSEAGLEISDMRGLYYRHPGYASALAICLASLAGLPPFAGFMAKYMAFQAAFQNGYAWVAILAALTSIAAFIYYMRVAALMFLPDRTPAREYDGARPAITFSVALGVVSITALGILPNLAYAWVAFPGIWTQLAGT